MEVFLAGVPVKSTIALADEFGNALTVDALEYSVSDQSGVVLVTRQPLAGFTAGQAQVEVITPASINTLSAGTKRSMRRVVLHCTVAGSVVDIVHRYVVQASDVLVPGVNSFQTFEDAMMTALDIPNLTGWENALDRERMAALVEARTRICTLNFSLMKANTWGMNSLNYVPEGTFISPYAGLFNFSGDITWLPAESFLQLPPRFLEALRKAQVAEANAILGGDEIEAKRQAGLKEDTVGESKQVFREGKVLNMGVSKGAMRYLAMFLNNSLRTSR